MIAILYIVRLDCGFCKNFTTLVNLGSNEAERRRSFM
jgi:hypothetical protein